MLVFVYEYTCSAGTSQFFADSLRVEGWAMLSAVVDDLRRIPGVEVVSFLAGNQLPKNGDPCFFCIDPPEEEKSFRELTGRADFTLVIAPELDGILAQRCHWVKESGGRLLGPSLAAIHLTADKHALAQFLQGRQVPTPETWLLGADSPESWKTSEVSEVSENCHQFPAVFKPRFGAGSLATYLVRSASDLARLKAVVRNEGSDGEMILQRFVPGQAASVAFLIGPKRGLSLPPASQNLSQDGRFHYLGGTAPLPPELAARARRLATKAIDQIPGLLGYIGVDVVLGPVSDGSQDYVIEINPRLTTSYIGLRALAQTNLAEALLNVAIGKEVTLKWRPGRIQFDANGHLFQDST
jgi:predicted ATP-grasp superfamily ATP-dependent carboligase